MAVFYGYTFALRGTQTTIDGGPADYNFAPNGTWRYTGDTTYFVVEENDGATLFNGDDDANEFVDAPERFGGAWEQTAFVEGIERQIIWDYTFTVTDGTTTWRVAVIDVDLNNDNDLNDAGEDGYFLVFPDGMPPPNTDLTTGGIVENDASTPHAGLGAQVVCFAAGSLIETPKGPVPVQDLASGDLVITADQGPQPLLWVGSTTVPAVGDMAPIVITAGTLGNDRDLTVSQQHAVLLNDWRAQLLYGQDEVLVRAVDLLGMDGVYRKPGGLVSFYHILLERHHLVQAHGIWTETLYPGSITLDALDAAACNKIKALFPELGAYGPMAATCLRSYEARLLAA
jgi:Hint domain-containing protein